MANDPDPGKSACSRSEPAPDSAYTVACPGVALPWPPVPPTFAVAWAWTSTAHLSTTVMTSVPPPANSARTLAAWPGVCATTTTIGDPSATPTTWSDSTSMGWASEGPRGTVTTPTAPESDTSTTRARVRAQLTGTARTLEVGTDGLRPVPVATGVETGAEAAGTSSRGAMTKAAVKARTLTPPTVRVNRCRMTAPPIDP